MRHGRRRHGWRLPWSAGGPPGPPEAPRSGFAAPVDPGFDPLGEMPQPLRVGPYVPPYRVPRSPEEELWPAAGATAVVDEPPWRQPFGPDPADGFPPVTVRGARHQGRRWVAVVAVLLALAVAAVAVGGLLGRPPARNNAGTPAGTGASPSGAPPFAPVTLEAEAASSTLTGAAQVAPYPGASGGRVVRYIGNWGRAGGPGALRFNGIVVPASGTYVLTLTYVNANMNEATRSVVITASGAGSAVAVVAGGSACCSTQLVKVYLVKGSNSITLTNPRGHGPTIDKVTIDLRQ